VNREKAVALVDQLTASGAVYVRIYSTPLDPRDEVYEWAVTLDLDGMGIDHITQAIEIIKAAGHEGVVDTGSRLEIR
jgi:hypothetical protein